MASAGYLVVRTPVAIPRWEVVFAFCIPFTQLVSADVGGTIFGQDVVAFLLLPFLLGRRDAFARLKEARAFFLLLGLWLLGQIVTDLIRQTPPEDIVRGWLKILFLGLQFAMLWLLLTRSFKLFALYMFGLSIALMLHVRLLTGPEADYPWKFGLGVGVVTLAGVLGSEIGRRMRLTNVVAPVLLTVAGGAALFQGARSVFGMALLAAAYVWTSGLIASRPQLARRITPARFTIFILAGLLFTQGLISIYGSLAESGTLGGDAQEKYEEQASGDTNIILGGRIESKVSTIAIADSPIIGHGSWARDIYYVRLLAKKSAEMGVKLPSSEGLSDLIPSHSHFFGAWVEAGIAGAIFWGWVLLVCGSTLFQLLRIPTPYNPVIAVAAFAMLWDIPFSPFGAEVRFTRAAQIALLLYLLRIGRQRSRPIVIGSVDPAHEDAAAKGAFQRGARPAGMFPEDQRAL